MWRDDKQQQKQEKKRGWEEGLVLEGVTGFAVCSFVGEEEERVVVWYLTEEQDVYSNLPLFPSHLILIIFKTVCVLTLISPWFNLQIRRMWEERMGKRWDVGEG